MQHSLFMKFWEIFQKTPAFITKDTCEKRQWMIT